MVELQRTVSLEPTLLTVPAVELSKYHYEGSDLLRRFTFSLGCFHLFVQRDLPPFAYRIFLSNQANN